MSVTSDITDDGKTDISLKEFHKGLDGMMNYAVGFSQIGIVVSISVLFSFGLQTGGASCMLWSWIISSIMMTITALSMAEICSVYPSAGSVQFWTSQIYPKNWSRVASYFCGWANLLGNISGATVVAYSFSAFFNGLLILSNYGELSTGQEVAMAIGILFLWSFMNMSRVDGVGCLLNFACILQIGTIFLIFIAIFVCAKQLNSAEEMFFGFNNDTGFSDSYCIAISCLAAVYAFTGIAGSTQMAEETSNASINAPMGMIYTVLSSAVFGFGVLYSYLLITYDDYKVSRSKLGSSNMAIVDVIRDAVGEYIAFVVLLLIMFTVFFSGFSSVTVTSRIMHALVKNNAFPFSTYLVPLHPKWKSPVRVVIAMSFIGSLILLLPLNAEGNTAFVSFVGISSISNNIAYVIPILGRVAFQPYDHLKADISLGCLSFPIHVISCIWLLFTSCLFLLPTKAPVTEKTMNWTFAVVFIFTGVGVINWYMYSKAAYLGPIGGHKEETCCGVGRICRRNRPEDEPLLAAESGGDCAAVVKTFPIKKL